MASGRQYYQREIYEDPVSGAALATGIFADTKDLQALTQATMDRAIDDAIDEPAFLAAIRSHQRNGT